MIRNIPLNYTREMLKAEIDTKFITKYDYLNFPYDFKICQSVGYAFINLRNKLCLREFYNTFNGRKWNYTSSSSNIKVSNPSYSSPVSSGMLEYNKKENKYHSSLSDHKSTYNKIY